MGKNYLDDLLKKAYDNQIHGNYSKSLNMYLEVLRSDVNFNIKKVIYYNVGLLYMYKNEYRNALKYFNLSNNIEMNRQNLWNISLCHLNLQDWCNGIQLFDNRYRKKDNFFDQFNIPQFLDVNELKNKNVIVFDEEGIGDQFMFSSQIPKLSKVVNKATIKVDDNLISLFRKLYKFPNIEFESFNSISKEKLSLYNGFILMGDMFSMFYEYGESLSLDLYEKTSNKKNIGVCWKANSKSANAHLRSVNYDYFNKIENKVSLQYGEKGFKPVDFLETFNKIMTLDKVKTVDTSVAHLCGLIGMPTEVLINKYYDWRWKFTSKNEKYSMFYPNVEITKIKN